MFNWNPLLSRGFFAVIHMDSQIKLINSQIKGAKSQI